MVNRLLGGFLGLLKGTLVCWVFLFFYFMFVHNASQVLAKSPVSYTVWHVGIYLTHLLPENWQKVLKERIKEPEKQKTGHRVIVLASPDNSIRCYSEPRQCIHPGTTLVLL